MGVACTNWISIDKIFFEFSLVEERTRRNVMGNFTLARLGVRLRKSWAEPPVWTRFSSGSIWSHELSPWARAELVSVTRLGISDLSCRMFTLGTRLGLGLESELSPEPSQCESPMLYGYSQYRAMGPIDLGFSVVIYCEPKLKVLWTQKGVVRCLPFQGVVPICHDICPDQHLYTSYCLQWRGCTRMKNHMTHWY